MAQQDLALRCQLHLLGTAQEQLFAQLFFQHLDGLADGRLGDIQLPGGFGEA